MIKNDLFYYIIFITTIIFIVASCVFIVLRVIFNKKQSMKVVIRKGFLWTLIAFIAITCATTFIPCEKGFVSVNRISETFTNLDNDIYKQVGDGEPFLAHYGALTRFATKWKYRIAIYNGKKADEYVFYTDENYTFIHFGCNFGEKYQKEIYCKIYKPFGSVVYNAYFNISKNDYLILTGQK